MTPLFASDTKAARLLDMKRADFLELVENGDLPKPRDIGGLKRWDMVELRKIVSGEAVEGMGEVAW